MPPPMNEDILEQAALEWLADQGYNCAHGPDLAPGMPASERDNYAQVVLVSRLEAALARLNPGLPPPALAEALRKLTRVDGPGLVERNHAAHGLLVHGVQVEYRTADGAIRGAQVQVLADDPRPNDGGVVGASTPSQTPVI